MKALIPASVLVLCTLAACGHDPADHTHDPAGTKQEPFRGSMHGTAHELGVLQAGDFQLTVTQYGDVSPGADPAFDFESADGKAVPEGARAWIGLDSAVGSSKAKLGIEAGRLHAHIEVPAELTSDSMLWLEIEQDTGKVKGSIALHR